MGTEYKNGKNGKRPKKSAPASTFFGSYVTPIFSSVAGQFNRRSTVFTGKNNTQKGRYSN